jgi:hypothetical protein
MPGKWGTPAPEVTEPLEPVELPPVTPGRDPVEDLKRHKRARRDNATAKALGLEPVREVEPGNAAVFPPHMRENDVRLFEALMELSPAAATRDAVHALGALLQARDAGDAKGMALAGGALVLAAAGMAPGVGGLGRRGGKLAMDQASRMARAKKLGWDVDEVVYHATGADFPAFRKRFFGGATGALSEPAFFSTTKPAVADSYLPGRYNRTSGGLAREYREGANVMPLFLRHKEKYLVKDMGGQRYTTAIVRSALAEARREGRPGVAFRNFVDPGHFELPTALGDPMTPTTVYATFAGKDFRSIFATFDPKKANSSNLMAGIIPVMTASGLVLLVPDEAEGE